MPGDKRSVPMSRPIVFVCLLAGVCGAGPAPTRVPRWDARGTGPLPWQGIACLDVNDDASRIAVGTIAPAGEANILLLDGSGALLRQQRAGERWINQVALLEDLWAVCTMPAGRS